MPPIWSAYGCSDDDVDVIAAVDDDDDDDDDVDVDTDGSCSGGGLAVPATAAATLATSLKVGGERDMLLDCGCGVHRCRCEQLGRI